MKHVRACAAIVVLALTVPLALQAREPEPDEKEGVHLGRMSILRSLVSEDRLEAQAGLQYDALTRKAYQESALLKEDHPTLQRVRKIANELLPHAGKFNERAKTWKWEINVINSQTINAFCMPGGKIVVFTGIIDTLKMTDDQIALVVGHEIAHALREHSRARAAKGSITNVLAIGAAVLTGSSAVLASCSTRKAAPPSSGQIVSIEDSSWWWASSASSWSVLSTMTVRRYTSTW